MEDSAIVALYWERDERAIPATSEKYGAYCHTVAANILQSKEDAEECVNDTWLGAWNAMPPHKPGVLSAFLAKITRNVAFNRVKYNNAQKRGGELQSILTELEDCTSGDPEKQLDQKEVAAVLNAFLRKLPEKKRSIFLQRYWYAESVGLIARRFRMTEGAVTMQLKRLREQLRRYLSGRGISI